MPKIMGVVLSKLGCKDTATLQIEGATICVALLGHQGGGVTEEAQIMAYCSAAYKALEVC